MRYLVSCFLLLAGTVLSAQSPREFNATCDTLQVRLQERTTVLSRIKLEKVSQHGGDILNFRFTRELADYPWRAEDLDWFRSQLASALPDAYKDHTVGRILCKDMPLEDLVVKVERKADYRSSEHPFVEEEGGMIFRKGLTGRNIALWQSHGRYYEQKTARWEWQRAPVLRTVEDMYTQSYVVPFLMPMLENAGAYVMTPRERDPQVYECVTDNDPAFNEPREGLLRRSGTYSETGRWEDAGEGFADVKPFYVLDENPFTMGTARQAACERKGEASATARWTAVIPERGEYAVYVSYKTTPYSTPSAHYTVHHLGGEQSFIVNQQKGGGTWIYLGTFPFDPNHEGYVELDNAVPAGRHFDRHYMVSADAVRFGGGMGKIARGQADADISTYETSGLPSFTEGALYWMQWAGVDTTVTRTHERDDYVEDYGDRGAWVQMMSGGSRVNPKMEGKGIPFDLTLAFHTDAGTTPNDSIIGTLSIYTHLCDGEKKYPNGEDRMLGRVLADDVQTAIVDDIRRNHEPNWSRRQLWDRSYSESRTTGVPGMLLELLSHQNFADMKYGLDPMFRFTVSRAIYKGMLKFLSKRYGFDYVVQPLPIRDFAAELDSNIVTLRWRPTDDPAEPTAKPTGYLLQTRLGDGAFDNGIVIDPYESNGFQNVCFSIQPGQLYSWRIIAFNEGGKSFPSEVLCAGRPVNSNGFLVTVVNDFDRVGPPAWFDSPDYAGFDGKLDNGVPYQYDISYIGEQYQIRRDLPWLDDDNPGFGASYTDKAGIVVPGNTFDFVRIHGQALMAAGYPFCSASRDAFSAGYARNAKVLDILCGKQATTPAGRPGAVPSKYQVFPEDFQKAIRSFTKDGGHVLVSGSNIGTDLWDQVYPGGADSLYQAQARQFAKEVLGYQWLTNYADIQGNVRFLPGGPLAGKAFTYLRGDDGISWGAGTVDGLSPASDKAQIFLRFTQNSIPAGIIFDGNGYKAASIGFPLETIDNERDMQRVFTTILTYFRREAAQ